MFETITVIIAALLSSYEILSRIIPTSSTWSLIGKILSILTKISDALDNKKAKRI